MRPVMVLEPSGVMHQPSGSFEVGRHLGELELDRLKAIDWLAELLPLAGVADRLLQRPARAAERQRAGDDADLRQQFAHMRLAITFLAAEAMAVRHEAVVQSKLGSRQRPDAHLRNCLA